MSAARTPGIVRATVEGGHIVSVEHGRICAKPEHMKVWSWPENRRRIVAGWNACDGVPTEDLEQLGTGGVMALTGLTEQYRQERDLLLAELKFVHRFWDQLNGNDAGRIKKLMDRMLDLQQPPAVPAEAAAIGAALDGESLEQGEPA